MTKSSSGRDVFPQRLREIRELRGLSQAQLAEKTRLQPAAVSHFETGTRLPSFDNLRRLASALEVSTDYLLGRTDTVHAAPTADIAFRDYQNLSQHDRELVQGMIAQMAKKSPGGHGGKES